jgi:hypothetical protein
MAVALHWRCGGRCWSRCCRPVTSFFSHWDVNYLLLASAAWYFGLRGQDRLREADAPRRGRWLDWVWAGLLLGLLTWLSFGNAVICGLVGLHLLWRELITLRPRQTHYTWRDFARFVAGALLLTAAVMLPWLLAWLAWGMNYVELLSVGMRMHFELVTAAARPEHLALDESGRLCAVGRAGRAAAGCSRLGLAAFSHAARASSKAAWRGWR